MGEFTLTVLFLVVLLVIGYRYAVRRGRQIAKLMSRGTAATGQVVDARRVRRSRTHKACRVRYVFVTSGGVRYEREIEVGPKDFENYRIGQDIEIVYDPADPENNALNSAVTAARDASRKRQAQLTGD